MLKKAWESVEASGVPEALHEVAFREAIQYLKEQEMGHAAAVEARPTGVAGKSGDTPDPKPPRGAGSGFFDTLASESGVAVDLLKGVLEYDEEAESVQVIPPPRMLGSTKSQQTRSVVALVAGARHGGLGEDPVPGPTVRDECRRKRCYDENNFSGYVGQMACFNLHNRNIKPTARWPEEFEEAIHRALGSTSDGQE